MSSACLVRLIDRSELEEFSLNGNISECVPDASVEHTSVEVDASVPRVQAELPLLVNVVLVGVVVVTGNLTPVVAVQELFLFVVHLVEVTPSLVAGNHCRPEEWLSSVQLLVSLAVVACVVVSEGSVHEPVDNGALPGALKEVVALIDSLIGDAVEKTGSELG